MASTPTPVGRSRDFRYFVQIELVSLYRRRAVTARAARAIRAYSDTASREAPIGRRGSTAPKTRVREPLRLGYLDASGRDNHLEESRDADARRRSRRAERRVLAEMSEEHSASQ